MFTINFIIEDDVLETTGLTQEQLDQVISGIEQAAALWSRYIDGNNAVIDIALGFEDLSGSTLAQAGSSFYTQNGGPIQSEVINELNGQSGVFSQDGTFTIDLPDLLNERFFFSDSLDFVRNPGDAGQIDFLTLAAHELGHVLGFLSIPFEDFVVNNQFIGANAVAANGGNPVQLADGVHTAGNDLLSPSISSNLREPLNAIHIAILKDLGIQMREATAAADILHGFNSSNDTLNGMGGNDTLYGLTGSDTLNGGNGNDILDGGLQSDIMNGGAGNDTILGGFGNDTIDGGTGVDTVDYSGFGGNIIVNLNQNGNPQTAGGGGVDTIVNVENIIGGDFADRLTGRGDASEIHGGAGGDRIFGLGGDDMLFGEGANDFIQGGNGDDFIDGGDGQDQLNGGNDDDTILGGDDNSLDRLTGAAGDDTLDGGGGRDILRGDSFVAGSSVTGGSDIFDFNEVNDSLAGGLRDIIRDFVQGEDLMDLSDIDAITGGSDDAFNFIGTGGFSGTAGEIRYQFGGSHTIISADVDGDGTADFQIDLNGNIDLLASDFVL